MASSNVTFSGCITFTLIIGGGGGAALGTSESGMDCVGQPLPISLYALTEMEYETPVSSFRTMYESPALLLYLPERPAILRPFQRSSTQ